jgi:hypothetical protein
VVCCVSAGVELLRHWTLSDKSKLPLALMLFVQGGALYSLRVRAHTCVDCVPLSWCCCQLARTTWTASNGQQVFCILVQYVLMAVVALLKLQSRHHGGGSHSWPLVTLSAALPQQLLGY